MFLLYNREIYYNYNQVTVFSISHIIVIRTKNEPRNLWKIMKAIIKCPVALNHPCHN